MPNLCPFHHFANALKDLRKKFTTGHNNGVGPVAYIHYLALALAVAIPISTLIFKCVMHVGHPTSFPSSELRVGFTSGPDSRGTINIIWACVSTIFTCVYVSLHLDVPIWGSDVEEKGVLAGCKRLWRTVSRKGIWIIFNIIAPELVAYVAIREWMSAKELEKEMSVKQWTLTHAFFADMGGFRVRESGENTVTNQSEDFEAGGKPNPTNTYVVIRTGNDFYKWFGQSHISLDYERLRVEIQGASKANSLLKTLTCIQAAWLVIQTIVRFTEHRPVSPLEVTACGYVVCTLITYYFWWYKPYGVQTHVLLHLSPIPGPRNQSTDPTPFTRYTNEKDSYKAYLLTGLFGAIIGAVHCSLWNETFVNSNGQLLWRICCIIQIVAPLIATLLLPMVFFTCRTLGLYTKMGPFNLALIISLVSAFLHFCARIMLFVLVGYSFWSLPEGVYNDVEWTLSWFPHWH